MKKFGLKLYLVLMLNLVSFSAGLAASTTTAPENRLKAAFLYNFSKFVDFPDGSFLDDQSPFNLCIIGESIFGDSFSRIEGKFVKKRKFHVVEISIEQNLQTCQMIYISSEHNRRFNEIIAKTKNSGVLTVGEAEGFSKQGGIIRFFTDNGRVRFEINTDAAKRNGIMISSKLLRLGKVVKDKKKARNNR